MIRSLERAALVPMLKATTDKVPTGPAFENTKWLSRILLAMLSKSKIRSTLVAALRGVLNKNEFRPRASRQLVVADAAIKLVAAVITIEEVVAGAAVQHVGGGVAVDSCWQTRCP